ncbi:DNA replication protein DnaC [Hathewaya proteolytica DSM 3090]|uniref:DNA replication protein DnaC n=1 Tax=Hathewaya proteolytica DSM 3090 TaxID=1121331 RepID=A0A1M6S2G4_9CLOT|nr:DNA replication protein DnaC [Hathewaya proteolytica DSM 3090]
MREKQSKNTEVHWKILNATSDCPYHECDGSGLIQMISDDGDFKTRFCKCREEKIYANRLKFANIPNEFEELTVNSFDTKVYCKQESQIIAAAAKKMTVKYITNFDKFAELGKGLYFYSTTKGSGKTRLAVSLGNALLKNNNERVKFITCSDLLKEIKNTYNKDSKYTESQLIESINNVGVLVIDDIGVEQPTSWVSEMLFNIFDNRMKYKRITILTSNDTIEGLKHDDRLKSRLVKMCIPIKMPEEDIRQKQGKKENEELQEFLLK